MGREFQRRRSTNGNKNMKLGKAVRLDDHKIIYILYFVLFYDRLIGMYNRSISRKKKEWLKRSAAICKIL